MNADKICQEIFYKVCFCTEDAEKELYAECLKRFKTKNTDHKELSKDTESIKKHLSRYFSIPQNIPCGKINEIIRSEADRLMHCFDEFEDELTLLMMSSFWEIYLMERLSAMAKGVEITKKYSPVVYQMH